MGKALGFIGLIFFGLVVLNWAFIQVSPLIPANPLAAYSPLPAQAKTVSAAPKVITKETITKPSKNKVAAAETTVSAATPVANTPIAIVPFFSQFTDIAAPQWQEVGCGITSLAMMIDFYKPGAVSVDTLLSQALAAGAYDQAAGWTYGGLIQLSEQYGLTGAFHDLSALSAKNAFAKFKTFLKTGPVILSVHNRFNPKSTVPHLVVIDGIKNNMVYYNDPAAKVGEKKISTTKFLASWKRKMIVVRPPAKDAGALSVNL